MYVVGVLEIEDKRNAQEAQKLTNDYLVRRIGGHELIGVNGSDCCAERRGRRGTSWRQEAGGGTGSISESQRQWKRSAVGMVTSSGARKGFNSSKLRRRNHGGRRWAHNKIHSAQHLANWFWLQRFWAEKMVAVIMAMAN